MGFRVPDGGFEVIVVDGMSTDGTREKLQELKSRYPNLILLDNPGKIVSTGMNIGIRAARGKIIVRTDVRCVYPSDYLLSLLDLRKRTKADNVGGVLISIGQGYVQKCISIAYCSRISVGGALRSKKKFFGETDTVYGGCFLKERLLEIGGYDETLVRNQDDELSFRIRELGGKVVQSSAIKVKYFPRKRFRDLFKQFLQYGYWKTAVIWKHPKQASLRHFMPSFLVLTLFISMVCALFLGRLFCFVPFAFYCLTVFAEGVRISVKSPLHIAGVCWAIFVIHFSFGLGFILGGLNRLFGIHSRHFETLSR